MGELGRRFSDQGSGVLPIEPFGFLTGAIEDAFQEPGIVEMVRHGIAHGSEA